MAKEYKTITSFELTPNGRDTIHLLTAVIAVEALVFYFLHFHEAVQMGGSLVDLVSGPLAGSLDFLDRLINIDLSGFYLGNPEDTAGIRERTIPAITRDPNGVMRGVQDFFNISRLFDGIAQQGR